MYKSPIEFIESTSDHFAIEIQKAKDEIVYQAVSKIGVEVDKEELLKALKYDRDQYQRGYSDGYNSGYEYARQEMANDIDEMTFTNLLQEIQRLKKRLNGGEKE